MYKYLKDDYGLASALANIGQVYLDKGNYEKSMSFYLLVNISNLVINEQFQKLESSFDAWKGNLEQVDDICIIGIKI